MAINNPASDQTQLIRDIATQVIGSIDVNAIVQDAVKNQMPVIAADEAKVNPYFLVGFIMLLSLIIMGAAAFNYIDKSWFALAVGIWISVPGISNNAGGK